jgi:hypothetical protein
MAHVSVQQTREFFPDQRKQVGLLHQATAEQEPAPR